MARIRERAKPPPLQSKKIRPQRTVSPPTSTRRAMRALQSPSAPGWLPAPRPRSLEWVLSESHPATMPKTQAPRRRGPLLRRKHTKKKRKKTRNEKNDKDEEKPKTKELALKTNVSNAVLKSFGYHKKNPGGGVSCMSPIRAFDECVQIVSIIRSSKRVYLINATSDQMATLNAPDARGNGHPGGVKGWVDFSRCDVKWVFAPGLVCELGHAVWRAAVVNAEREACLRGLPIASLDEALAAVDDFDTSAVVCAYSDRVNPAWIRRACSRPDRLEERPVFGRFCMLWWAGPMSSRETVWVGESTIGWEESAIAYAGSTGDMSEARVMTPVFRSTGVPTYQVVPRFWMAEWSASSPGQSPFGFVATNISDRRVIGDDWVARMAQMHPGGQLPIHEDKGVDRLSVATHVFGIVVLRRREVAYAMPASLVSKVERWIATADLSNAQVAHRSATSAAIREAHTMPWVTPTALLLLASRAYLNAVNGLNMALGEITRSSGDVRGLTMQSRFLDTATTPPFYTLLWSLLPTKVVATPHLPLNWVLPWTVLSVALAAGLIQAGFGWVNSAGTGVMLWLSIVLPLAIAGWVGRGASLRPFQDAGFHTLVDLFGACVPQGVLKPFRMAWQADVFGDAYAAVFPTLPRLSALAEEALAWLVPPVRLGYIGLERWRGVDTWRLHLLFWVLSLIWWPLPFLAHLWWNSRRIKRRVWLRRAVCRGVRDQEAESGWVLRDVAVCKHPRMAYAVFWRDVRHMPSCLAKCAGNVRDAVVNRHGKNKQQPLHTGFHGDAHFFFVEDRRGGLMLNLLAQRFMAAALPVAREEYERLWRPSSFVGAMPAGRRKAVFGRYVSRKGDDVANIIGSRRSGTKIGQLGQVKSAMPKFNEAAIGAPSRAEAHDIEVVEWEPHTPFPSVHAPQAIKRVNVHWRAARLIAPMSKETQFLCGPATQAFAAGFKAVGRAGWRNNVVYCATNNEDSAVFFANMAGVGPDPVYGWMLLFNDVSGWDTQFQEFCLRIQNLLMDMGEIESLGVYAKTGYYQKDAFCPYLNQTARSRGEDGAEATARVGSDQPGATFIMLLFLLWMRFSGDSATSCGNSVVNGFLMFVALLLALLRSRRGMDMEGAVDSLIATAEAGGFDSPPTLASAVLGPGAHLGVGVLGDDNGSGVALSNTPENRLIVSDCIRRVYAMAGIKTEPVVGIPFSKFNFCSSWIWPCRVNGRDSWYLCPMIARTLLKGGNVFVQPGKGRVEDTFASAMDCMSRYGGSTPIVRAAAAASKRLIGNKRREWDDGFNFWDGFLPGDTAATAATWRYAEDTYGISRAEFMACENAVIRHLDEGGTGAMDLHEIPEWNCLRDRLCIAEWGEVAAACVA